MSAQEPEFPAVVVLGSRVYEVEPEKRLRGEMSLQPMVPGQVRCLAAAILFRGNFTPQILVSGGNVEGVRYSFDPAEPRFDPPNLSFEAVSDAMRQPATNAEAQVFSNVLVAEYDIPWQAILMERESRTTRGNAFRVHANFEEVEELRSMQRERVGLVTNFFHMSHALECFHAVGLPFRPVWAEDWVAMFRPDWVPRILEDYERERGIQGEQLEMLRKVLCERAEGFNRSVEELVSCELPLAERSAL